jgi:replication factor C small subunit
MNNYQDLWVQRYSPKTIEEIVLSIENKDFFSKINEDTPHLLLYGNAGTGKTSLAKILVKDVLKCQYLYINASDENGIDTIRNKVTSFSQTCSFDGKKKVIILDEFCGTTPEAQRTLKGVMEEYASTTRFILTANHINRIIEPIQSRCLMFNIVPSLDGTINRCFDILKAENVFINNKNDLIDYIKNNFPDIRRIVNDLQMFSLDGTLEIKNKNKIKNYAQNISDMLIHRKVNILDIRKFVIEEEKNFAADYQSLLKELFDIVYSSELPEDKKKGMLLDLGEYMYKDNFVVDHEINFFCCILNLNKFIS